MKILHHSLLFTLPLAISACATHIPTESTQQEAINPQCLRDYPKPEFNANNMNSPEMTQWLNHMLECQKRHR